MPTPATPSAQNNSAANFLAQTPWLAQMREVDSGMTSVDRKAAAQQLLVLLRDYYVHLPLKRSSLGIDPVQETALLIDETDYIRGDTDYFSRLMDIVNRLRDRHTAVRLPSPWLDMVAFLPFALESYFDATGRHLIVSKSMTDLGDPNFVNGVEVTHWNGTPIRRYVESLSWKSPGANPFARIAVTLRSLTARPLGYMLPPDEDWVQISYRALDGSLRTAMSPWFVYLPQAGSAAGAANSQAQAGVAALQGLDRNTLVVNGSWYDLYTAKGAAVAAAPSPGTGAADPFANIARWQALHTPQGDFGYLRLFSFDTQDPAAFVQRFAEVLGSLPAQGLILDLRANPGGTIPAGEALMGLFTTDDVSAQPVSFRNTSAVRRLGGLPAFAKWRRSLDMQYETGEIFTQGYSLGPESTLPRPITYRGPVVLIIDALCYSTTDFFTAGMQDNGLAAIIGVDPVTGAGGANVWNHRLLAQFVAQSGGSDIEPMPSNLDIDISMRRSIRVGPNEGLPVEGAGVFAEIPYQLTRRDILEQNQDLIDFATQVLAQAVQRRR